MKGGAMKFEQRFKKYSKEYRQIVTGFKPDCPDCQTMYGFCCEHSARHAYETGKLYEEGDFSHEHCETCNALPGLRFAAHGQSEYDKGWYHLEICADCAVYIAYDELPEDDDDDEIGG